MDRIVGPDHFRDPVPTLGDRSFTVSVAGLAVAFDGLSASLHEACLSRYAPFLSRDAPMHTASVHLGEPAYLDPASDKYLRLEESGHPEGRVLLSSELAAFWRAGSRHGDLRLSRPGDMKLSLMGLENYLRWVTADLALQNGGFVLHSAGLVRDGRAYVFFGPSGAGKSTVAGLSPGCAVLSDDLVLLKEENGRWMAASTPFWGTLPQESKSPGLYPLAGLYRLVQSPDVRLEPIPQATAVAMLLACCPFVANPTLRRERLIPLVESCAAKVPPRSLRFRKNPTFWTIITPEAVHG